MKVKLKAPTITENYTKNLLRARGINDIEKFLFPDASCLQDWRDLENIKDGVNLIFALRSNARVGLIVDCDVDGYTSATTIYLYLKRLLPNISITHYVHDGKAHGLEEHWEQIRDENFDLVIIPDAGSNDGKYAKELGCPVLVIDHHLVDEPYGAPNMTIINNQLSPKYKNKNLSGVGVVYQFCRAMDYYFEKDWANDYIDLAALGIDGDMMSALEVENQYLWHEGFMKVKNYFFLSIARKQAYSLTGKMGATDNDIINALNPISVAFYIVPLINAMVRVGTQEEKERMFVAFIDGHKLVPSNKRGAKGALEEVAIESVRECTNAKTHQNKIKEQVVDKLEQKIYKYDLLENKILFIRLDDDDVFPPELNGLVAMQLSAQYKRPTIVARLNDEGYIRGSARGLNNSELASFKNYLDTTDLFEYTAGHDQAFGISIPNKNLSVLHQKANSELSKYDFGTDYYEVDFERRAMNDDLKYLIYDVDSYGWVWGQQNPEPLIHITDLHFSSNEVQIMGKNKDTIKIMKNGITYIKFFAKDLIEELKGMNEINMEVVGKANVNVWNGTTTPQIQIENYEFKEDRLIDF